MIKFNSIKLKNFRSYKQETIFSFNKASFNLIIGENGAGKSSIFRALIWGLIGTDSEGIKGTNLKNWNNRGNCFVKIDFNVDDKNYVLYRQQSPNKLRLNDEDIDQETIDNLFNFNTKLFSLILFMSQFSDQFIHASSTEKLELFTQILELERWNQYSENAKGRAKELNNQLHSMSLQKERLQGKKETLNKINHEIDKESFELARLEKINLLAVDTDYIKDNINTLNDEIKFIKLYIDTEQANHEKETQEKIDNFLNSIYSKKDEIEQLKCKIVNVEDGDILVEKLNEIRFEYKSNEREKIECRSEIEVIHDQLKYKIQKFKAIGDTVCKECNQAVSGKHAKDQMKIFELNAEQSVTVINKKITNLININSNLLNKENELEIKIKELKEVKSINDYSQKAIAALEREIDKINSDVAYLRKEINLDSPQVNSMTTKMLVKDNERKSLERELQEKHSKIKDINNEINPYISKIEILKRDKEIVNKELKNKESEYVKVENEKSKVEYWVKAFKEIKLLITEESIKEFNYFCNDNLQKLGLPDWTIENSIDKVLKNKKVKRGFNTLISSQENESDVPLNCFSGGEQQRLKLAMVFGLIDFLNSRIKMNIEVYDEPTQWLNNEGIDDLLNVLKDRSNNKSIYLIDHRDFKSNGVFDEIHNIEKTEKGSEINEI